MSQKPIVTTLACPPGTLAGGPVRTRFFDGMFLTKADLEAEQRYWRIKRRLTNRALGEGVVWGLRLEWRENRRTFVLSPGYALDCCGNDLVVEQAVEIGEQQLWSSSDPSLRTPTKRMPLPVEGEGEEPLRACVVLQYVECPEEPRTVHQDACAGPTGYCEPSRIRESTRLMLVAPPRARPPTPPEQFLDELYKWRDGLDPGVRDVLFPDPGLPPPTPASGVAPLSLRVGVGSEQVSIQVPAAGETTPQSLEALEAFDAGRPTGVVTFELFPSSGWHMTSGQVLDAGRTVETVTPPASPSMYWSLDVALPDQGGEASIEFEFVLDAVEVAQIFGGAERGRVYAVVSGFVRAAMEGDSQVRVAVGNLVIRTQSAEVVEDTDGQGCLEELIPWGWTVDPANGSKIARTLVLASLYAFLSEVTRRGASPVWRTLATIAYSLGWYLLFGVNPTAGQPATEVERAKLAELILTLYARWCRGFAYPGPQCLDEHHGVYLGCVELSPNGAIQSLDMWEGRRYVLTGPLLNHWGAQLGVAPLDVIVGRFVGSICCLAGLPPLGMLGITPRDARTGSGFGTENVYVGSVSAVETYAKERGTEAIWVTPSELMLRAPRAFAARATGDLVDVYAAKVPDGNTLAIAVERGDGPVTKTKIHDDVETLLRRGSNRVRESGREAVASFTVNLLRAAPASALLGDDDSGASHDLAKELSKKGVKAADVAVVGTTGVLVRAGHGESGEMREAAADLVERAELAIDGIALAAVEVMGPKLERGSFGEAENQEMLTEAIVPKILPSLAAAAVKKAAKETSSGRST